MDIYDRIEKENKADKTGNIVETVVEFIFGLGSSFLVNKAMKRVYEPKNIQEKILMGVGSTAVGMAISHCAGESIHGICHPKERYKRQQLINQMVELNEDNMQLTREVMDASRTIRKQGDLLCQAVDFPDDMENNGINIGNFESHLKINGGLDIPMSDLLKEDDDDE